MRRDGQKVLLAVRAMGGESGAAWRAVLDDLVARGLRTPEFLIIDGAAGLEKALAALWPAVPAQRCTVHKHRNLLLMQANVHAADVQDRDGGVLLMATLFGLYPFLLKLYADSGYRDRNSGRNCTWSADISTSRSSGEATPASSSSCRSGGLSSAPLPSTYTSTNRCRRLAKDWERTNRNARAFLLWASIRLMLRKLCRKAT